MGRCGISTTVVSRMASPWTGPSVEGGKVIKPNWYNTLHADFSVYYDLDKFGPVAKSLGYPYFMWNGRIYLTDGWKDTGLTTRDLPPLART
jgi:hypothetical protein